MSLKRVVCDECLRRCMLPAAQGLVYLNRRSVEIWGAERRVEGSGGGGTSGGSGGSGRTSERPLKYVLVQIRLTKLYIYQTTPCNTNNSPCGFVRNLGVAVPEAMTLALGDPGAEPSSGPANSQGLLISQANANLQSPPTSKNKSGSGSPGHAEVVRKRAAHYAGLVLASMLGCLIRLGLDALGTCKFF